MTAPITPAGLILSGALDIRHRYCRLLAGLEEARAAADPGTRAVLEALVPRYRSMLRKHGSAIRAQVVAARAAAHTSDPQKWTPAALKEVVHSTVNGFSDLAACHQQLYQQLDGSRQIREDLRYLLYRALDLSLVSKYQEGLVSLKTSGNLQWETTGFEGARGRTAAVAVPWLESLGPLRWPLIAHEVGHYFLPAGGDAIVLISEISQANGWSADAFAELLADAIAQRHFGASYSFALAREGYLYSYRKHVTGGLSVEQRLRILAEPQDLLVALPPQWGLSQREPIDGAATVIADPLVSDMRAAVDNALGGIATANYGDRSPNRFETVAQARELLAQPEPAPAVLSPEAHTLIADALHERSQDIAADIGWVADAAVHVPLTDGEIFEAAWREEVCSDAEQVVESLATPLTDERVDADISLVTSKDIWLARSLQSAAVHRWLLHATNCANS